MKTGIHPTYYSEAKVTCANCGHNFDVGGTQEELRVEICSQCHPFFTGKKMVLDTAGRVEKFKQKMAAAEQGAGKEKKKRKLTLEERVNEELAVQLEKARKAEEKGN